MAAMFFILTYLLLSGVCGDINRSERQVDGDLEQRVRALENSMETCGCKPHTPVAFKAHMSHSLTAGADQIIVFDNVQLNLGQAYHAHNGNFLAPTNGVYLFSVSICSTDRHFISLDLVRNGSMLGKVLAGDNGNGDCSSETTIVQLTAGDDVYVKHHGTIGDFIVSNEAVVNSFTGALLQAM